jgi:hypothetical protein
MPRSYGALQARLVTPIMPALVLLTLAAVVVTVRVQVAADGDLARSVVAGARRVDVEQLPSPRVPVNPRGYDGLFYYRLAVDPADLSTTAHGIRLDSPLRRQRIGYPLLPGRWPAARQRPSQQPLLPSMCSVWGWPGCSRSTANITCGPRSP